MDINTINIISLAYLGDSIYEVYIREKLIKQGIAKVEELVNIDGKNPREKVKNITNLKSILSENLIYIQTEFTNKASYFHQ